MPKSRNNSKKDHKKRLIRYKVEKKKKMDALKKNMIDEYLKMQQQKLAETQTHTSTEEVSSEIEVDSSGDSTADVNIESGASEPAIDVNVDVNVDNMQIEKSEQ